MALKFDASVAKVLKVLVLKFLTFVEITVEKQVGGLFDPRAIVQGASRIRI